MQKTIEAARSGGRARRGASLTTMVSALAMGVMLAAAPGVATAQTDPTTAPAEGEVLSFDIQGQDLGSALVTFADRAGLQIFFDAAEIGDLRSTSVSGRFTVRDGLRRLLDGTGVQARFTGPATVSIVRPAAEAADGSVVLDPVLVEAETAGETARGPVEGYVAHRSASGTKTDTPLIETPQAVNVVTRDQMEDQGVQSITEGLRYTPGVVAQYGNNDLRHDWLTVRGFTPGRYVDGLRLPFGARGYAQPRVETYGLERIEVLKGPASIMYGQGAPGGTVNMVKKRPTDEPIREIQLQAGSFDRLQAAFDIADKIGRDDDLLVRLVALARDSDTQFDHVEEEKQYVAPSLTWRPRTDTELTLFGEYQKIDSPGGGGAPALPASGTLDTSVYPELPRDAFVGEPGFDDFTNEQWFAGYEATHDLNDTWSLRQNLRYGEVDVDTQRVQAYCPGGAPCNPGALLRYAWAFPETASLTTVDTQATADFRTGGAEHTLLMGVDYSYEDSTFQESQLQPLMTPFNAYDPTYGTVRPTRPPVGMQIDQTRSQMGVYAQDQIDVGNLHVMLGGRHDWADTDTKTQNMTAGTTTKVNQKDREFTGRAGIVYTFDNGVAPYASASTSFQPASGTDRAGQAFDPTTGEQVEIGVKVEPSGLNGMITVAAFQLTQENVLTPDPVDTRFNQQTGEVRIRGLELEGKAEVTENFSLIAAYAYTQSEITKANANSSGVTTEGNDFAFVPTHQASLWGDYTIDRGPLRGLGLGAGVRYMGDTYGDNANTFDVDGYTLVDAAIRYDLGALSNGLAGAELSVDAQNLFDKTYVATCLSETGCYQGVGRTVYATLTYRW